jgi:hypothetical protein
VTHIMTGGCQCGAVRYTAKMDDFKAYLCHCRMCQRATGNVSLAFKGIKPGDMTWESEPNWYASSAIARRPFCAKCGTPLGFQYSGADKLDLTVGSFDDPSPFFPTAHFAAETIHEAWIDTSALRRDRADEYAPLVERWKSSDV